MSKVSSTNQAAPNLFTLDYTVDAAEFQAIKEKSIDEAIKDVEVEGFRKGKAPRELAMSKIEPAKVENLILQNTFAQFEKPAIEAGRAELDKKGRHFTGINVNFKDNATKEQEDGSFVFQLVFNLLPQIDVSKISKIKLKETKPTDIPGRPKLEDFVKQEKDKLFCNFNRYENTDTKSEKYDQVVVNLEGKEGKKTAFEEKDTKIVLGLSLFLPEIEKNLMGVKAGEKPEFDVNFPDNYPNADLAGKKIKVSAEIKSVLTPQYKDLAEVFEKSKQSSQLEQQFGGAEQVAQVVAAIYERETSRLIQNAHQRQVVDEVMKAVPDFDMNEELLVAEVERILSNLKSRAEENKTTLGEEFSKSFPGVTIKDPTKMTEKQAKEELEKQVRAEFKWANILSYIYQAEVADKPSSEDFNQVKEAAHKEPEKYGFTKDTPKEQIEGAIVDRIVRQVAFTWVSNQIEGKDSKVTDVESKPKAKKETKTADKKPATKPKTTAKKK
jgi:trigger factor